MRHFVLLGRKVVGKVMVKCEEPFMVKALVTSTKVGDIIHKDGRLWVIRAAKIVRHSAVVYLTPLLKESEVMEVF